MFNSLIHRLSFVAGVSILPGLWLTPSAHAGISSPSKCLNHFHHTPRCHQFHLYQRRSDSRTFSEIGLSFNRSMRVLTLTNETASNF